MCTQASSPRLPLAAAALIAVAAAGCGGQCPSEAEGSRPVQTSLVRAGATAPQPASTPRGVETPRERPRRDREAPPVPERPRAEAPRPRTPPPPSPTALQNLGFDEHGRRPQ
ncbi:MAG TPA: hypothetical protein VM734_27415, partial [Kofleriaceae bacterium]|nr:hypothetical protein [Kofleriaceae bacterium]